MNKKIIHTVFENRVFISPDRIAVEANEGKVTYQRLNQQANQTAHLLRQLGGSKEATVATMMPAGIELVVSMLAIFKAGGVYLPVDLAFARKRLIQVFRECAPEIILTSVAQHRAVEALIGQLDLPIRYLIVLHPQGGFTVYQRQDQAFLPILLDISAYADTNPELISDPEDGNYLFYTSGSTGEGKAMLGCHKSLSHFLHWQTQEFGIDASVRVSQLSQITFDASLRDMLLPLTTGGTLCIPSAELKHNPAQLIEWLEARRITLIHCVPSLFKLLTKELLSRDGFGKQLPDLSYVLMAGEALYQKDIANWRQAVGEHVEIVNLYGTSETTLAKTFHRIAALSGDLNQVLHVGKPISHTVVAIINEGIPCTVGEIGEIYIKTPFATKGYYKNEALTRSVFVQNPLVQDRTDLMHRTGDLGRYTSEGNIEVLGRKDDQVKVNGIRVELNEVKQAVLGLDFISQAEVVAHQNSDNQQELICYYTGTHTTPELFRSGLQTELNESLIPAYFVHLDEFPLTINGKVDKKALPKPEAALISGDDYEAPANVIEHKLEEIFKTVLGLSRVGRKVAFFKIGGTSLKAIQMISRIYKEYEVLIKINDIFANPTIGQLAEVIARAAKASYQDIRPVPVQESYDVSLTQRRLWIASQFEEESIAYNMPAAYRLEGALDREAFAQAFAALVERHESLRTHFITVNGEPRQKIQPATDFGFQMEYVDLRAETDREFKATERMNAEANRVFHLSTGPLLKATLIQLEADQFVFVWNMHHIISDGWSMDVLIDEVLTLYKALQRGEENPLSPLRIQYKDYSAWQNKQLGGERLKIHREYWLRQFAEGVPVLELPTDFPRPKVQTFRGQTVHSQLSTEVTRNIRLCCEQKDVTLFMLLLAGVQVLLNRYSGQPEMVIGTPTAGRNHKDLEDQIGFYINILALKTKFDPEKPFSHLLSRVKETTLGAYEHNIYPFIQLVEDLNLESNLSRTNLFDVVVQMQDTELAGKKVPELEGIKVTGLDATSRASKFDLTFNFVEAGSQLCLGIEYNTDLFLSETIGNMQQDLMEIFREVGNSPEVTIHALRKQLQSRNDHSLEHLIKRMKRGWEKQPALALVHTVFEQRAQQSPRAIALEKEGDAVSYQALNEGANQLTHLLLDLEVTNEQVIGTLLSPGVELTTALLAIFKAGGVYLPIDQTFARKRLQQVFSECAPGIVITDRTTQKAAEKLMADLAASVRYLIVLEPQGFTLFRKEKGVFTQVPVSAAGYARHNPNVSISPEDGNYLFYTSGSTGEGKAMLGCHKSLSHFLHWQTQEFGIDASVRVSQLSQITFDASLRDMLLPLTTGGTLCIPSAELKHNPAQLIEWLEARRITLIHCVPSLFKLLTKELLSRDGFGKQLPDLSYVLMAGEALYQKDIANWRQAVGEHVEIVNLYGTSETTLAKTFHRIAALSGDLNQVLHVGKPIADTLVLITNGHLLCEVGEIGEIYIATPYRTKGYYNRPQLTGEVFVQNPLVSERAEIVHQTGDHGRYLKDGSIEVLGRKDDQVKVNGIRVELNEVRQAMLGVEGVRQVEVVAHKNKDQQVELIGYYTGLQWRADVFKAQMKDALNENMMPAYCIHLDEFPLTINGKIDKKALPKPESVVIQAQDYLAPANATEKQLEEIWKQILGLSQIGTQVSFFKIGGTSLKAIQMISRIYKAYEVLIKINDIFANPTIGQLSQVIARAAKASYQDIRPVAVEASYEVSLAQRRLWIASQFEEESIAYNIPSAYWLEGELDQHAFGKAFATLVQRHESLRTTFIVVDGEPRQVIHPSDSYGFQLEFTDLQNSPARTEKAYALAEEAASTVFDLTNGPLLQARLIQLEPDQYVFLLTMHHIISDGWSMEVLINEVLTLYKAYKAGEAPTLEPLNIQYKDYTAWQNQQLRDTRLSNTREYWLNQLEGDLPSLELPLDFDRPLLQTFRGNTTLLTIDSDLREGLQTVCWANDTTLFMVFVAAVNALLYRYSGQKDIIVGLPIAGRNHKDLENQIGFYVNMLALRLRFESEMSFRDLLTQTRKTALDAYEHEMYPFIQLVEDLKLGSNLNRTSLFDVVVQMQDAELEGGKTPEMEGITVKPFKAKYTASKFDLTFNIMEMGPQIYIGMEYNTDLFLESTIDKLKNDLLQLLQIVSQHEGIVLKELRSKLLEPSEQSQLDYFSSFME